MKNKLEKFNGGEGDSGLLILIALSIIIFVFIIPEKKLGPVAGVFRTATDKSQWNFSKNNGPKPDSIFASRISIGSGNASYEIDPFSEYIVLEARGDEKINISGWSLKNSKDTKTYEISGNTIHFNIDSMMIPKAATYISPTGNNNFVDIVLDAGDRVIVSSGTLGINSPYKIINFRENKCSGYLEKLPEYKFIPSLETNCPSLKREVGFNDLNQQCKDYVSTISSCHTPKFNGSNQKGEVCSGCVDNKANLSNSCVNFIRQHSSYEMCINDHKNDSDFNYRTWRIFLGRSFEMWSKSDETISLLDNMGKLVNYISY